MAEPSRKNSGLETTSKFFSFIFFAIILFTSFVVPTGTVDLVTTIQYLFILLLISSATFQTNDRSASPSILLEGVPTVMKIISASCMDADKEFEKLKSFVLLRCLSNKSSIPGS